MAIVRDRLLDLARLVPSFIPPVIKFHPLPSNDDIGPMSTVITLDFDSICVADTFFTLLFIAWPPTPRT